jgi:phosphate transport system protein
MDDMLDRLHAEFIQQIFQSHAEQRLDLQVAVQLALVARFYERIGDHAVNCGNRVRYMVTGWLPGLNGSPTGLKSSFDPVGPGNGQDTEDDAPFDAEAGDGT